MLKLQRQESVVHFVIAFSFHINRETCSQDESWHRERRQYWPAAGLFLGPRWLRSDAQDEIARFQYGSITDAAKFGDVVILSAYFPRLAHILKELQNDGITLSGKLVIDTMNPLNVDANFNHYHDLKYMERTSVTQDVQRAFPEAIVFKAFNSMPATLLEVQKWAPRRVPPIIFIGGNPSSIDTVRKLIKDTGFKPQFAGYDLNHSGLLERLGVLLHLVAENEYEGNFDVVFDVMEGKA